MDTLEGLRAELPIDAGAVNDDIASCHRPGEALHVVDGDAGATGQHHRAVVPESLRDVAPDEAGASGDRDLGRIRFRIVEHVQIMH